MATLYELVIKTAQREKGEKKREPSRPYSNFSFEVNVDLENYVMEIFVCLKLSSYWKQQLKQL